MSRFLNGIKSFVHSISTNDHYASYDPSRPQGQEDTTPLATTRDDRRSSTSSLGKTYSPGMRSAQMSHSSTNIARSSVDGPTAGPSGADSIPLTDMAPIPSAELSWSRIDQWIEQNYPELYDQLLEGATSNDLNDLEHDLDCSLPADVRESYSVHDGQEPGSKPTGVFFGITLLDLEGISEEWNVWRRAAVRVDELTHKMRPSNRGPSSSLSSTSSPSGRPSSNLSWIEQQRSCPPEAVQPVYAHPGWIPLAKDFDGNNIAVDLAPGPKGRYGQIILFGRDFDTKFVVSPSWGDFLAQFAADLESGQCYIDEDVDNPMFAFKANNQLVSYFSVLRSRVERTLPKQPNPPQQQQRRSMSNVASVTHAPVNSGRVTPRLISPTGSSSSLPIKDNKSKRVPQLLVGQMNEVDLNDEPATGPAESNTEIQGVTVATAAKPIEVKPQETKQDIKLDSQEESKNTVKTKTVTEEETTTKVDETKPEADGSKPEADETKPEADGLNPEVDETKPEVDRTKSEEDKPASEPKTKNVHESGKKNKKNKKGKN